MTALGNWLKKNWPIPVILIITILFFWKFFFRGLLPIPGDIIVGTYLPWFDLRFSGFPAGVPVRNNVLSDVVSIMYPWRMLAIDLMKSGVAPLWNPYILSGNVLLANFQSAPFYPLNIIYWLVSDFSIAWSLQIIFQPLMAAVFLYIFLKNNRLSKLAAFYGAVVWGFSGFFMVWLEYNTIVHASLYLPLILFSIQKSINNKKYYLLVSFAIALSFYAGYPQVTLYILASSLVFILLLLPRLHLRNYLSLIFFMILGVGLSLPFLIPGYEMTGRSIRQVDEVANMSNVKFVLPEQIITFVAPDYFGNPTSRNYWFKGTYENAVLFASVPAFLLLLVSFLLDKKYKSRLLIFSWAIFFVGCILAFKNPISLFFGNSKTLMFSSSVMGRLAIVTTFGMAISSAIVLDLLIKGKINIQKLAVAIGGIALLLASYGVKAFMTENDVALRNLIFPSLVFVAASVLVVGSRKLSKIRSAIIVFFVLLTIFDLYRFHDKYNPFSPKEFLYPKTAVTDYLITKIPERFEVGGGSIMPSNMWMPYGLHSSSGQDAVHPLRYNKFLSFLNTGEFKPGDRYTVITNYNSTLFDFLGISNVVVVKQKNGSPDFEGMPGSEFDDPKFTEVLDDGRTMILKNTKAFPRAFAVKDYVQATDDAEFSSLFSDIDLRKTVILEEVIGGVSFDTQVSISGERFDAQKTSIKTEGKGESLVVFSQSHLPGWKGFVDGREVPVYRANYAFMALVIPPGSHEVLFEYQPDSFKIGLIGGIVSLGVLLASALYFRYFRG
jgi:hypothetical protein